MSGPSPTVSVVLPTYERSDVLGDAIESVLGRTYDDLELLVVDDGADDATPDLVVRRRPTPVRPSGRSRGGQRSAQIQQRDQQGPFQGYKDQQQGRQRGRQQKGRQQQDQQGGCQQGLTQETRSRGGQHSARSRQRDEQGRFTGRD